MRIDVDQEECTDGQAEAADIEHTQVSILNEYGEHEFVSDGKSNKN